MRPSRLRRIRTTHARGLCTTRKFDRPAQPWVRTLRGAAVAGQHHPVVAVLESVHDSERRFLICAQRTGERRVNAMNSATGSLLFAVTTAAYAPAPRRISDHGQLPGW